MAPKRERDLILQIARMRFEERLSQRQIGQRLGVSEATVSRAIKEAFELDLVEVHLRMQTDRNPVLEPDSLRLNQLRIPPRLDI